MHVNKHVRTCEGVRVFACECTACADRGRVSGRASSEQGVDRKHGGTGTACQGARGCGPGTGGCLGRGHTGTEKVQRVERSREVGGGARGCGQAQAKYKADTGIALWPCRGWHSRTLGPVILLASNLHSERASFLCEYL